MLREKLRDDLYTFGAQSHGYDSNVIHDMRNTKSNSGVFIARLALVF